MSSAIKKISIYSLIITLSISFLFLSFSITHASDELSISGIAGGATKVAINVFGGPLLRTFNGILYAIFIIILIFIGIAAMILDWVINPVNITSIMGSSVIYDCWTIIRDLLNISFILVLLFSALSTIFQVESFNIKKMLAIVLIMALLVNFSFPISRFIIDIANSAFYTFLNSLFPASSGTNTNLGTKMIDSMNLVSLIAPFRTGVSGAVKDFVESYVNPLDLTIRTLLSVVFSYLLLVTLLIMALLFLIRFVSLSMLIIFSPIGFVGFILPATKKFSSEWWDLLLKNAFFAPVMSFFMLIAIKMLQVLKADSASNSWGSIFKNAFSPDYSGLIQTGCTFMFPIIILWMGMMSAQKIGAYGADAVIDKAKKWSKDLGNWTKKQVGKETGLSKKWDDTKKKWGIKQNLREGKWAEKLGVKGALSEAESAAVSDAAKRNAMETKSDKDLEKIATSGGQYEKLAAIEQLAKNGSATKDQLEEARKLSVAGSPTLKGIEKSITKYDPRAVFSDANGNINESKLRDFARNGSYNTNDWNVGSITDPKFMEIMFQEKAIKQKDVSKLREKADKKNQASNFDAMLEKVAIDNESNEEIQLSYTAQTGKINLTPNNSVAIGNIIRKLDKNTARALKFPPKGDPQRDVMKKVLADNLNISNYKDIVGEILSQGGAKADDIKELNEYIALSQHASGSNAEYIQSYISKDPFLNNLK